MVETKPDTETTSDSARTTDGSQAAASFNRALLESMPDGVVACDAHGVLTLFNRAAREWHGADPLRVPPTEWADHYNLCQSDGVAPLPADEIPLARAYRGEPVANEEMAIAVPGRPVRFVVANGTRITDATGANLGAVVVMHDVTELRRVEAELRLANQELEARVALRTEQLRRQCDTLRGILDSAAAPIFSVDCEYRYTAFNRHHANVMRLLYGAEIKVGKCLLDCMTRVDDRNAARRNLDRALAGETHTAEAPSGEDSRRRYFRVGHSPIRSDRGETIGVAVLAHDITDRRQAEEKLQKSEQLYRDIFDNVFDGISLVELLEDGRFRIVEANPALERLAGIPRSLMVGRTHAEVFAHETACLINETYGRCVERACPTEEDVLLDLPAGRRQLQVLLAPTVGPDGRVIRIVSIWRDVTEGRRAEAERRANLRFFEGMDRVNRAIQGTADITQMMSDVLDVVLELLECDRAYLVYPCNPDAATWTAPMERTSTQYPGLHALNLELPVDRDVAETFRVLLATSGPVQFGPGTAHRLPEDVSKRFGFKCFMAMAVYPKVGEPWQFGVHQCSHARRWTPEEERLVREIGRRIADALTSLLTSRSLQESEAKYRQIVDTAAEGVWMLRSETHASYANAQMASMLGYDVNELLERPVTDFMPEEDRADHHRRMQNRRRGLSEAYERRFLRRDGSILWTHVSATPILDDRGHFKGSVAMFTDITQRKRTEEELRQSTELTRAIIDAAPTAIIGLDLDGRVCLAWNRAAEELLGWRADEVMGKFLPSVPTEKREEFKRFRARIREGLTLNGVEVRRQRRDGSPIDYSIYASPMRDGDHEIIGNVAVLVDITERRRLEEQLRQTQKMDAIGTLAGGIAHDFNNILTGIIGYGELLAEELPLGSPARESVRQMLATSERGAQLTSRLLAFSRRLVVDPKPVDLNEIVRNVDKFLRRLIGEDVELSVALASKDLIIMADSGQIEQVLVNLAVNARDAMQGGGHLAIVTKRVQIGGELGRDDTVTAAGEHAMISVTDSGVGMDKQTRERMFDPFFTTKEVGKGTGLGLAIVYGIVKQHGGVVDVSSELGKGTSLRLFFPVVAQPAKSTETRSLAPPASGTETVLLAEDDATVRGATATFLRNYGYQVVEANDGQEALEKFAACGPKIDILLLDVIMPKKSGREVYDLVMKERPDLPVLFMSGYTADVIDRQGLLSLGLKLLSKPFSPFELLRRIRALLDAEE